MTNIHCIPVNLYPAKLIKFNQCTVVHGVIIKKYEGQIKNKIDTYSKKLPEPLMVKPTHFIYIDQKVYLEKLKQRLKIEGHEQSEQNFSNCIDSFSLAKQAVMALIFSGLVSFSMHGVFSFSRKGKKYTTQSYSNTNHFKISFSMASGLLGYGGNVKEIKAAKVTRYGKLLDKYYREGIWSIDRYAMALTHFWGALCTQFSDQSILGFTSTLECLLSTTNMEITHTLAERAAFILHNKPSDMLNKYNEVKSLYNVRSKLVHGKSFLKKGPINNNTLCVSPKIMNVPSDLLIQAFNLSLKILITIINNENVIGIIQNNRSEENITKGLNDYYTKALFNIS